MITNFFTIKNATSRDLESYTDGNTPFVSNSVFNNGVVRYVDADRKKEVIDAPCIAVNGFGFATLQLKPFIGSGNGGVHVVALMPNKKMSVLELAYYSAQINLQSWRFSYGRRAIQRRLLQVSLKGFDLSDENCNEFKKEFEKKAQESVSELFI